MAKAKTILEASKQVAAVVGERALKGKGLKEHPKDLLQDHAGEKQGGSKPSAAATTEGAQGPGDPNEMDHSDQQPGQEVSNSDPT